MGEPAGIVATLCAEAATSVRSEWAKLVAVAVRIVNQKETVDQVAAAIAKASGVGMDSVKRKILAIQKMQETGFSAEEIVSMGQFQTLGHFQKGKRQDTYEQDVWMRFKIKGSQREIVTQQIDRVKKVLHLESMEDFWDWFYAQVANTTDEELIASAGMHDKDSKKTR
jgi:hypothetical protein